MAGLDTKFELELLQSGRFARIIGIDEVGRGCWAGPVAVGAFIFDLNTSQKTGINDSKKLSKGKRHELSSALRNDGYAILYSNPAEIDDLGIGKAIEKLITTIVELYDDGKTFFLIDGQFSSNFGENTKKVIKGDSTYYCIAAASILAKVDRDNLMTSYDEQYPDHSFSKHKGYGTKAHMNALEKFGVTDIHRKSYKPIQRYLTGLGV